MRAAHAVMATGVVGIGRVRSNTREIILKGVEVDFSESKTVMALQLQRCHKDERAWVACAPTIMSASDTAQKTTPDIIVLGIFIAPCQEIFIPENTRFVCLSKHTSNQIGGPQRCKKRKGHFRWLPTHK